MRSRVSSLALLVLLVACDGPTAPATLTARLLIITELRDVGFTLTNDVADTLVLAGCCHTPVVYVERRVAGRWDAYSGGVCPDICPAELIPVAPRDSVTGSLLVGGPGTFRLKTDVAHASRPEASERIVSASFTISVP